MTAVVIEIDYIKLSRGQNEREHWRVKHQRVKRERTSAYWAVKEQKPPKLPVKVRLVRLSPGTLDYDNLVGAFKAIQDGVADAYRIADNDERISWVYDQARCPRGEFGLRIEISPA